MAFNNSNEFSEIDSSRLFNLSLDMLGVASFDGYFVNLNPSWEKVLGFGLDELYERPYIELVHPDDRASTMHKMAGLAQGEQLHLVDIRFRTKSGSYRWLEWNAVPFENERLVYFVARDVTRVKEAEEARSETQERLRSTLASLDDQVFLIDSDGIFEDYYQPGDSSKLFAPPHQFLGKYFGEVLSTTVTKQLTYAIDLVKDTGQVQQFDYSLKSRDGKIYWFNCKVSSRFNFMGEFAGVTAVARNITERKQNENAIEYSQQLYRTLARHLPNTAVMLYDHDFRYILAEGPLLGTMRANKRWVEDHPLWDLIHGEQAAEFADYYRRALADEAVDFEYFSPENNLIFHSQIVPIKDNLGQVTHGLLVLQDITKQLKTTQRLQETLARTQILYRASNDLLKFTDLDTLLQSVADSVVQAIDADWSLIVSVDSDAQLISSMKMGGTQTQNIDMPSYQLLMDGLSGWVMREKQPALSPGDAIDEREKQTVRDLRQKYQHSDIIVVPLWSSEKVIGTLTAATHIGSKRLSEDDLNLMVALANQASIAIDHALLMERIRENEKQYRQFIDNASDIMYFINKDGFFTFVSPIVERVLGYKPSEIVGKHYLEVIAPDGKEYAMRLSRRQVDEHIEDLYSEYPIIAKDGSTIWIGQNARTLTDNGTIIGFQGIARDITARRIAELDREQLIEQLDSFAQTVAHDLKNPLNIIYGYTEILADTVPDGSDMSLYTSKIARSAEKMHQIIEELLKAAKMRSRGDVQFDSLNMNAILGEVQTRIAPLAEKFNAQITYATEWPIAVGHAPWIEEAWVNYISNAIKYGGSPAIITVGSDITPDMKARFWVCDSGEGLSEEEIERLFREFSRIKTDDLGGHGLGLSIVKRLIQQQNGTVGVESRVGAGSCFWFTLPLYQ